jgi:predicted nucleic acid-binding protein
VILVDTSVWVDHFRRTDDRLVAALEDEAVLTHPFVIGEVACGNLNNRVEILGLLGRLPTAPSATDREALEFIESRQLMAKGIGYIDVHLLASTALLPGALLWTKDQRLAAIAAHLRRNATFPL